MKVKAPEETGGDFKILDAGTYAAVCTQIVGIGMQQSEWQGIVNEKEKVKLRFEVPSERVEWTDKEGHKGEGPMVIWLTCTASLHENAKLRQYLESWRGKSFTELELMGFDLDKVLGAPCMISVIHREYQGKTYANIDGISKLMKGIDAPKPEGEVFSFDPYDHTPEELEKLPKWLRELVGKGQALWQEQQERARSDAAEQHKVLQQRQNAEADDFQEDDIPF